MTFNIDAPAAPVGFPLATIGSRSIEAAPCIRAVSTCPGLRRDETLAGLRILVVEQDVAIGPLLAEMLEDVGAVVCGVEVELVRAAEAATLCRPDLIIVDVGLGATSAVEAIHEILLGGEIPCVFVTDANLRESTLWPGAALVRKPFRAPEIVTAIGRAMGDSRRDGVRAPPPEGGAD